MQYINIPVEALAVLGFSGALLTGSAVVALTIRYRFSKAERRFIDFVLKEAKTRKIEKGNLPGFLFENFDRLRVAYVKSLAEIGEINISFHISDMPDLRNEILNSYM